MKKLITILMLAAIAIIAVAPTADAKTKKQVKTSSKVFTPSLLLTQDRDGLISFKSGIGNSLVKAGFSKSGHTYRKNDMSVNLNGSRPTQIIINFSNSSDRDKFINQTNSLGFQWDGLECSNGWEKCMDISVSDNEITLTSIQ